MFCFQRSHPSLEECFPGMITISYHLLIFTRFDSHSQLSFWISICRFDVDKKSHLVVMVKFSLLCAQLVLEFSLFFLVQDGCMSLVFELGKCNLCLFSLLIPLVLSSWMPPEVELYTIMYHMFQYFFNPHSSPWLLSWLLALYLCCVWWVVWFGI